MFVAEIPEQKIPAQQIEIVSASLTVVLSNDGTNNISINLEALGLTCDILMKALAAQGLLPGTLIDGDTQKPVAVSPFTLVEAVKDDVLAVADEAVEPVAEVEVAQ